MAVSEGHHILAKGPVSHFLYKDKPVPVSASLVSKEFAKAHPQALKDFVQMVDQAVEIARKEPDKVRGYFEKAKYGGLPADVRGRLFLPVMAKPTAELRATTEE